MTLAGLVQPVLDRKLVDTTPSTVARNNGAGVYYSDVPWGMLLGGLQGAVTSPRAATPVLTQVMCTVLYCPFLGQFSANNGAELRALLGMESIDSYWPRKV